MEVLSIAHQLFNGKIAKHPIHKSMIFKLIDSPEEAKRAFKLYSKVSVLHTDFIRQLNITADTFYEEGLKHYSDLIVEDRLSFIALDQDNKKLLGFITAKD